MLLTATTLRDSVDNVTRWVARNLAMGVDHLIVFLDAPGEPGQEEVHRFLEEHPHTTVVPADAEWWDTERPDGLNVRQRIHANLTLSVLRECPWAEWLFHIDGDEVVDVDRSLLSQLPASTSAVWLTPLESVSRFRITEPPTQFKTLLGPEDLAELHRRGLIDRPRNQAYFHGHVLGKSGVRPGSGLGLTLHEAIDDDGQVAPRHEDPALRVLHYDAPSGEEFVRKWTAMATAGPARFRPDRQRTADALRDVVGADLTPEQRAAAFERIYRETTEDDVEALAGLGLLTHVDPAAGTHVPATLDEAERAELEGRLADVRREPKRAFHRIRAERPESARPVPTRRPRWRRWFGR